MYESYQYTSKNGSFVCMVDYEMVYDGYETFRFHHKLRYPFVDQHKSGNLCSMKNECSKPPYDTVFHIKSQQDIKLFYPIPYISNL